jgi:hypothetical protein
MPIELTESATALSQWLRDGDGADLGILETYPGAGAFTHRARIWFNNAASLCLDSRSGHDFRVCGAVYGIRHGLELWLKSIVHEERFDAAWLAMQRDGSTLASTVLAAKLKGREKATLKRALCGMRNVWQKLNEQKRKTTTDKPGTLSKIEPPDCFSVRQEEWWAEKAIGLVRDGKVERSFLATVWAPFFSDHDLMPLWREAKSRLARTHRAACIRANEVGIDEPASIDCIEATCELFAAIDPDGDALRFPSALTGEWHSQRLTVSLPRLGELASELENSVMAFEDVGDGSDI